MSRGSFVQVQAEWSQLDPDFPDSGTPDEPLS